MHLNAFVLMFPVLYICNKFVKPKESARAGRRDGRGPSVRASSTHLKEEIGKSQGYPGLAMMNGKTPTTLTVAVGSCWNGCTCWRRGRGCVCVGDRQQRQRVIKVQLITRYGRKEMQRQRHHLMNGSLVNYGQLMVNKNDNEASGATTPVAR